MALSLKPPLSQLITPKFTLEPPQPVHQISLAGLVEVSGLWWSWWRCRVWKCAFMMWFIKRFRRVSGTCVCDLNEESKVSWVGGSEVEFEEFECRCAWILSFFLSIFLSSVTVSGEIFGRKLIGQDPLVSKSNRLCLWSFGFSSLVWGISRRLLQDDGWFSWSRELQPVISQIQAVHL